MNEPSLAASLDLLDEAINRTLEERQHLRSEVARLETVRADLLYSLKTLTLALTPYGQWDLVEGYHKEVKQALIAIARAEGKSVFGNDWQDALS